MGKLDVGVGDEFPVNEPEAPAQARGEGADERGSREDWRRRRDEWRQQRRAWRAEWRDRKRAFKDDIRRSVDENFGPHTFDRHRHHIMRAAIAAGLVLVAVAVLPFTFLLGIVVAIIAMFATRHGFFHHDHDDAYPSAGGRSDPAQ